MAGGKLNGNQIDWMKRTDIADPPQVGGRACLAHDPGCHGVGSVWMKLAVNAGDKITVATGQEWTALAAGPAGAFEFVRTGAAAGDAAALAAAIIAEATSLVNVHYVPGQTSFKVITKAKDLDAQTTLAENTGAARVVVSPPFATAWEGNPYTYGILRIDYTVQANDVAILAAGERIVLSAVDLDRNTEAWDLVPMAAPMVLRAGAFLPLTNVISLAIVYASPEEHYLVTLGDSGALLQANDVIYLTLLAKERT